MRGPRSIMRGGHSPSHALARPTCTHAARHSVRICKRCTQCSAHAGGAAAALMCRRTCPPTGGHSTARWEPQAPGPLSPGTHRQSPRGGRTAERGEQCSGPLGSDHGDDRRSSSTRTHAREAPSLPRAELSRPRSDTGSQAPPGAAHGHPCRCVPTRHARSAFKIHKSPGAHITHTCAWRIYCTDAQSYAGRACIYAGRGPFAPRAFR